MGEKMFDDDAVSSAADHLDGDFLASLIIAVIGIAVFFWVFA
jgi:hypothetical protein